MAGSYEGVCKPTRSVGEFLTLFTREEVMLFDADYLDTINHFDLDYGIPVIRNRGDIRTKKGDFFLVQSNKILPGFYRYY